ncbi:hypothetical protein BYT27DRAFT_7262423 [Phlegmacium glaucopus]|nr:hypothetical protein BYT27DRAFT_7262423 [Phlegmacium glaucopus]
MWLDIGAHNTDNKCRVVKKYEHAWWTGRKPRSLATVNILDQASLEKCLEVHQIQLASFGGAEVVIGPLAAHWLTMPASLATASELPTNASDQPTTAGAHAGTCDQCTQYCEILGDILQDFLDVQRFSNAMSAASKNQWNLDMRRASTFNLLHKAAVIKETTTPDFSEELHGIQELPPSSYKWTWGETLTEAEGRLTGDVSSPSLPTSHGRYDEVLVEVSLPVPLWDSTDPPYMAKYGHLIYDPLACSSSSMLLSSDDSAAGPCGELPLALPDPAACADHLVADDWSLESSEELLAACADVVAPSWSSASDTKEVPMHQSAPASVHAIADSWSEATGDNSPSPARVSALAPTSLVPTVSQGDYQEDIDQEEEDLRAFATLEDWSSASEQDRPAPILAKDWSSANVSWVLSPAAVLAEDWSSDNSGSSPVDASTRSSSLHPNSQFGVSPYRITLEHSHTSFGNPFLLPNMSQEPSTSSLVTTGSMPVRRYGPEHFGHLQDNMFEEEESEEEAEDSG